MTTSSSKALVRVIPVGGFLAVVLAVALLAAPDTFRYRGWPKAAPSSAPQSLVGLTPRLDARDPLIGRARLGQIAVAGVSATHPANHAAVQAARTPRGAVRAPRATGVAWRGSSSVRASGKAHRVARGGQNGAGRHGDANRAAGKPSVRASAARFARHAAPVYAARLQPVHRLGFYARIPREGHDQGRHLGWLGHHGRPGWRSNGRSSQKG